jgi:hypothetical protein
MCEEIGVNGIVDGDTFCAVSSYVVECFFESRHVSSSD